MRGCEPDDDILARVYILSLALQNRYAKSLSIQFDAFRKDFWLPRPSSSTPQDSTIKRWMRQPPTCLDCSS
jgi:hypothetical protein